jgi:uncharacterized protein YegP (UPF0339 family)
MFHLHRSSDNQFYFTLRARNGRVPMTSETYSSKAMAKKGIWSVCGIACNATDIKDHTLNKKRREFTEFGDTDFSLTTERMVNGKLKPVRVTAGKKKGK